MTECFVFGSNLAGRHGAGSALEARLRWGAELGVGVGPTGSAYAIPTKDAALRVLPLSEIIEHVGDFRTYAKANPGVKFQCVAVGTGLAGYNHEVMVDVFSGMPRNVVLPAEWCTLPITSFKQEPHAWLSNFHEHPIYVGTREYRCAEGLFQSLKLSDAAARRVFEDMTGAEARRAGRLVTLRPDWELIKVAAMREVVRLKFASVELAALLVSTRQRPLIEGNRHGDRFWGQVDGVGENWLGKLLEAERGEHV